MHSAGKDELRVVLEPDERVLADLRLLLKADKYTKRKRTTSLLALEEQILQAKATLNRERGKAQSVVSPHEGHKTGMAESHEHWPCPAGS